MQVHVLASGSTGNAVLIEIGERKFLVDAGISARRIVQGLAGAGVQAASLEGIFITHEHSDHIKGLDVFVRKHQVPVYARPAAWGRIPCRDRLPRECCRDLGEIMDFGLVRVEPFSISHDAVDPVGYAFYYKEQKCVLATDMGMVTDTVEQALAYTDVLVLESNHDVKMVETGPYPYYLKKRILGDEGHLSNLQAGTLLSRISRKAKLQVFLAHLSQHNNLPRLAEQTVAEVLQNQGCAVGEEIILHRTHADRTASFVG